MAAEPGVPAKRVVLAAPLEAAGTLVGGKAPALQAEEAGTRVVVVVEGASEGTVAAEAEEQVAAARNSQTTCTHAGRLPRMRH